MEIKKLQRWNTRPSGGTMERKENGEWIRYEDVDKVVESLILKRNQILISLYYLIEPFLLEIKEANSLVICEKKE